MNIYFHKIIFSCFLSLFIAEISAKTDSLPSNDICKVIKGQLADFRTKNDAEEVEISLKSMVTGKIYSTETDEEGNFYFYKVPLGKCSLSIVDRDYRPETFAFETNQDHLKNFTFSEPFKVNLKVSWLFNWGDRTIMLKSGEKYVQEHYWSHLLAKIVLGIYTACLILIFYYSCIQMTLAIAYVRNRKKRKLEEIPLFDSKNAPKVTIQLPMYNEMYVAERIIETAAAFDYPRDKFQIQVLDDSTDETKDIIAAKVAELAATGLNIQHIHRVDRTGYKAGALDDAMDRVQGEFIAIFDADFVPDKDFLIRTMPYFKEGIGVVQTRWGHLNKTYSLLTELQAFGLNGHFAIEQGGRNASGHFINFNGTAGIWRKTCIEEAGGWEHDTLTEDLDLSYRAQMRGWKFKYLEDVESPAELPITMSALKSQQHRWMKGGAECFIKMWKSLITFPGVKFSDRIHGFAHLFNSSVFVFILILSILSLFVLHIKDSFSDLNWFIQFGAFFIASTLFLSFYYWHSWRDKKGPFLNDLFRFIGRFIQFLTVSMALSLSNAVAVIEGYLGIKSSFVRTPKFNVLIKTEFKGNKYDKKSLSIINILEGLLMLVFGFTAVQRAVYGDLGMVPFHLMLTCGYGIIFFSTLKENRSQG
jgi:cellulose synthase/poly-beta-1,6-N-acetylglucosamine synthase-like glycosyltransferase